MGRQLPAIVEQHSSDIPELGRRTIELRPKLDGQESAFRNFCRLLVKLIRVADGSGRHRALGEARDEIQRIGGATATKGDVALKFACSVVVDVVAQGWELSVSKAGVELRSPRLKGVSAEAVKQRIREGHLLERDAQLRQPAVRDFIKGMEQRRLGPKGWVSIFSLMRDGRELASRLHAAAYEKEATNQLEELRSVVTPYLQIVETGATCEFTGLRLTDVWRYFRHTWVNTYKSLPGRSMTILVRDAAAPYHPVIGIAALGSSMAQQTQRDEWIGWNAQSFVENLTEKPTARMCRWIHASIERLIGAIYLKDLLSDGTIKRREISKPTEKAISRLLRDGKRSTERHRLYPNAADHKSKTNGNLSNQTDWQKQAATALFRSKRAKTLALLLGIRSTLCEAGLTAKSAACLRKVLATSAGRHAIRQLVRLVKGEHVGVDMMDIIVCGAVAPYNVLLGGKLICLLLASPEVVQFYRNRYVRQESIIASSMNGKAIVRPPNLVLLATTSLYGVGSSQYNRLRVPLDQVSGKAVGKIEYVELGVSKGYGSYQFSRASIDYVETLLGRAGGGRKVNSIFGEGVNPLMRKLRDGLAEIALPTDELLMHGNPRLVYGVPLARNFREILLGLDTTPRYFLSLKGAANHTRELADYWRRRWLAGRITRPGILEQVAGQTLSYPVTHGARVRLPETDQAELFD